MFRNHSFFTFLNCVVSHFGSDYVWLLSFILFIGKAKQQGDRKIRSETEQIFSIHVIAKVFPSLFFPCSCKQAGKEQVFLGRKTFRPKEIEKFSTTFWLYKQHQSCSFCSVVLASRKFKINPRSQSGINWKLLRTMSLFNLSDWSIIDYPNINFTLQVSTSTGVISHFVNLQVVTPEAFILGSGELHVDMGSAINLVCIIEKVRTFSVVHFLCGAVDWWYIWALCAHKHSQKCCEAITESNNFSLSVLSKTLFRQLW